MKARFNRSFQPVEPLESRVLLSVTLAGSAGLLTVTPPPNAGGSVTVNSPPIVPVPPVAATGTVAGTVTDANGNAVPGAVVTLDPPFLQISNDPIPVGSTGIDASGLSGIGASGSSNSGSFGLWPPGLTATADQNGVYTLNNVQVGQYTAFASDPTAGFGSAAVTVTADQTTTADLKLATLTIPPPATGSGTVTGSVLDSNGSPVVGATVSLLPSIVGINDPNPIVDGVPTSGIGGGTTLAGGTTLGGASSSAIAFPGPIGSFVTTTDASGNFSLSNVPSGSYTVFAYSSTAGSGNGNAVVSDGQTATVTINLQAPPPVVNGSVGGSVTDAQGNAVAGASVTLLPPIQPVSFGGAGGTSTGTTSAPISDATGGDSTGGGFGLIDPLPPISSPLSTTTDSQGNFNFDTVPVGTYTLIVHQDGFQPYEQTITVTQGQPASVAVTLKVETPPPPVPVPTGTGTVNGTVTDSGGAAVQDSVVILVPASASLTGDPAAIAKLIPTILALHATTDSSGNFEIDNVPAGDYIAFAAQRGAGFAKLTTTVTADQTDTLAITLSSTLPSPVPQKTVNTIVSATKKADARAKKAAALAAKKAAQAAKKAAAVVDKAAARNAVAGSTN